MSEDFDRFDNDRLAMLSFAASRSTWVSASSCVARCGIPRANVNNILRRDELVQTASYWRYDYRIRRRPSTHPGVTTGTVISYYLSAVRRSWKRGFWQCGS